MNKKKIIKLVECNTFTFNMQKSIEELTELSLVLQHALNKPKKDFKKEITEEIGDVKLRLVWLENQFSKKEIKDRINFKYNQIKTKKQC